MPYEFEDEHNVERREEEAAKAPTPENLQRVADAHLAQGRIETAIERYRKAVSLTDNGHAASETRGTLGDAYVYADQTVSALKQFRRAIRQSPRRAQPHFSLGELYRRYGKIQAALIEFRRAIECDPKNAFYHYRLGDCLSDAGYLPEAIGELEAAVELSPADPFYHFWLSDVYLMSGRLSDAIREMQQAAMFSPYDHYYNMRLGVLYMLSDSPTDAATAVMHAIKLSPRNAIYHCLIADIYAHNIGDDDMASQHYAYAGDLDDYDREHVRRLRELTSRDWSPDGNGHRNGHGPDVGGSVE